MAAAGNDFASTLSQLPVRLYYQDEARFGRINTVQKCWCKKGVMPTVKQQLVREYSYVFSAICPQTGASCSLIMPQANTEAMNIFLQTLSSQQPDERIILCMDKAGWHTTKKLERPENIIFWFLPPYSPELNPVELFWRELRAKYFNNRIFKTMPEVEDHLCLAIEKYTSDTAKIKQLTKSF